MIQLAPIEKLLLAAVDAASTPEGRGQIETMRAFAKYVEPGYDNKGPVVLGNWNAVTRWDEEKRVFVTLDDSPSRVGSILTKRYAAELEWDDEWSDCSVCGGIFRTSPDCWQWAPSYVELDAEHVCLECLKADKAKMADYLHSIEGGERHCCTLEIDLEDYGYVKLNGEPLERGLYGGQCADPGTIARRLRMYQLPRFVFELDSKGQFDMAFNVWYPRDGFHTPPDKRGRTRFNPAALERTRGWFSRGDSVRSDPGNNGPDPAEAMKRGLAQASALSSRLPEGGVKLVHIDLTTGLASGRTLTPDEFAKGVPHE